MPRRSGRLASRQLGDADMLAPLSKTPKEGDGETSVEELREASSIHEEAPEKWGEDHDNDDDGYDDDRDMTQHTWSRGRRLLEQ
jgi:hypothetical protein